MMQSVMRRLPGVLPGPASLRPAFRAFCSGQEIASKEEIGKLVSGDKVVVFMKGTPDAPQCGFSKAVVSILGIHDVPYSAVNVLEHPEIREGVKAYAEWPTIPQVYVNGEFVGGCDIMIEMHQSGDLVETLKKHGIESKFEEPPPKS